MKLQKYELQEDFMGMEKGEFFTIAGVYNDKEKLEEEIIILKLFVEFNKPVIETDFNNGYYQGMLTMLEKITEILE
jgi:hypothetical protein